MSNNGTMRDSIKKRVEGEARKKMQMRKAEIGEKGEEILDEKPLFVDVGLKKESINDKIRRIVAETQAETVAKLKAQNLTPEEAEKLLDEENDFSIEEDVVDILTAYENDVKITELTEQVAMEQQAYSEAVQSYEGASPQITSDAQQETTLPPDEQNDVTE